MQARLFFPANSLRQVQMLRLNRFALACHFQSFLQKHNGLWISANKPPNITSWIYAHFSNTLRSIIYMSEQAFRGTQTWHFVESIREGQEHHTMPRKVHVSPV